MVEKVQHALKKYSGEEVHREAMPLSSQTVGAH